VVARGGLTQEAQQLSIFSHSTDYIARQNVYHRQPVGLPASAQHTKPYGELPNSLKNQRCIFIPTRFPEVYGLPSHVGIEGKRHQGSHEYNGRSKDINMVALWQITSRVMTVCRRFLLVQSSKTAVTN
jgi:hypothetical protein